MIDAVLAERIRQVADRLEAARLRSGRTNPVRVVAVTKTRPVETVRAALDAGMMNIGENRVAELEAKVSALGRAAAQWHFVGRLQRRKARRIVSTVDLLHSLDSLRLARTLSERAVEADTRLNCLVQVNPLGEEAKAGVAPDEAVDVIGEACELPGLRMAGVMSMAPWTDDRAVLRSAFRRTREVFDEAARQLPSFHGEHLSMGMSNDYEIAVEEGSSMVRLGTSLFGERDA